MRSPVDTGTGMLAATWASASTLSGSEPAIRAVGYRQLWEYVKGRRTLAEAQAAALQATRQLVRRQLTWIRADAAWQRVDPLEPGALEGWIGAVEAALAASAHRPAAGP